MTRVLVLAGGPDAERPVSLASAKGVARALAESGYEVNAQTIDRPTGDQLSAMRGEVVFPVLHGVFGEGGPLQDLLEADGRPFVGSGPGPARLAMDKLATKIIAAACGSRVEAQLEVRVATPDAALVDPADLACPLPWPVIVKPVREGSSIGLVRCDDESAWRAARARAAPGCALMVERWIAGRELTVGVLDGRPLPIVEIVPACGVYDYQAKYDRNDTEYRIDPTLPTGVARAAQSVAVELARALGTRHIARVDLMLDEADTLWVFELNTMPGFTPTSLLPKAAAHAGLAMPQLCDRLVRSALRDHNQRRPVASLTPGQLASERPTI